LDGTLKNPNLVIPEYPITTLDHALMRRRTLFSAVEVKALGKVEKGLSQAFTVAQASEARYIIITDGDTWHLYDASKSITEALVCEWSILREKSKEAVNKARIIANTGKLGSLKALTPIEAQPREKLQKCPHCGYKGDFKLLQTWRYSLWNVYYYECPKCSGKFRFYVDPKGEKKSYVIPVIRRNEE